MRDDNNNFTSVEIRNWASPDPGSDSTIDLVLTGKMTRSNIREALDSMKDFVDRDKFKEVTDHLKSGVPHTIVYEQTE